MLVDEAGLVSSKDMRKLFDIAKGTGGAGDSGRRLPATFHQSRRAMHSDLLKRKRAFDTRN